MIDQLEIVLEPCKKGDQRTNQIRILKAIVNRLEMLDQIVDETGFAPTVAISGNETLLHKTSDPVDVLDWVWKQCQEGEWFLGWARWNDGYTEPVFYNATNDTTRFGEG